MCSYSGGAADKYTPSAASGAGCTGYTANGIDVAYFVYLPEAGTITLEEHQRYSLPAQRERLDAFCHAQYGNEWSMAGIYTDTESSTHMDRPGLKRLPADAEAGDIDILLVFRVDRLNRKVHELGSMID